MPTLQDLTGQRFGRLTVLAHAGLRQKKHTQWVCLCDCGEHCTATQTTLRQGLTRSCGCLRREVSTKRMRAMATRHGHAAGARSKTYGSWEAMRVRCADSLRYISAGVKVCERWANSFENFLADMGERPPGTTLDRWPNPAGDYEPSNCRWATAREQRLNQKRNLPQFQVEDLA